MRDPTGSKRAVWMAAGAMLLLVGCSSANGVTNYDFGDLKKPFFRDAQMEGPPRVQNCGIIAISTPSTFRCNGKTYTSIELAEIAKGKPLAPRPKVLPSVPRSLSQP